jgi:hypothetical protein
MRSSRTGRILVGAAVASALLVTFVSGAGGFTSWTVVASPSPHVYGDIFNAVSARTASDVWAVGGAASATNNATFAARWNGTTWKEYTTPNPVANCHDGNFQWTGNRLNGVVAISGSNAWAVGTSCYQMKTLVERWDGTKWSIVPSPSFKTGGDGIVNVLNGVAAVSASNIWAVGTHTASNGAYQTLVEHWNGSAWSVVPSPNPSPTSNVLTAVAASGASDVWAVGYSVLGSTLIEHWNGTSWSVVPSAALPNGSVLYGVRAISPANAWAVGTQPGPSGAALTLVLHWDGQTWSVVSSPNMDTEYGSANVLKGITAISANDVWAVGMFQNESTDYHQHRTLTLHWDGAAWSVVSSPSSGESGELNAVSALATGKVWATGLFSNYEINIYDGAYTLPQTLVLRG